MVGKWAWVPFAFGGVGYVFGGWLSGWLMQRGLSVGRARKFVMACGAAFLPGVIVAPLVPEPWMAIGATCFLTFGHALWVANLQTLPTDLFRDSEWDGVGVHGGGRCDWRDDREPGDGVRGDAVLVCADFPAGWIVASAVGGAGVPDASGARVYTSSGRLIEEQ